MFEPLRFDCIPICNFRAGGYNIWQLLSFRHHSERLFFYLFFIYFFFLFFYLLFFLFLIFIFFIYLYVFAWHFVLTDFFFLSVFLFFFFFFFFVIDHSSYETICLFFFFCVLFSDIYPKFKFTTYGVSIVMWFLEILSKKTASFYFSLLFFNYWCSTTILWTFKKIWRNGPCWKSFSKLPTLAISMGKSENIFCLFSNQRI